MKFPASWHLVNEMLTPLLLSHCQRFLVCKILWPSPSNRWGLGSHISSEGRIMLWKVMLHIYFLPFWNDDFLILCWIDQNANVLSGDRRGSTVAVIFVAAVTVGVLSFPFAGAYREGEGRVVGQGIGTEGEPRLCTGPPRGPGPG